MCQQSTAACRSQQASRARRRRANCIWRGSTGLTRWGPTTAPQRAQRRRRHPVSLMVNTGCLQPHFLSTLLMSIFPSFLLIHIFFFVVFNLFPVTSLTCSSVDQLFQWWRTTAAAVSLSVFFPSSLCFIRLLPPVGWATPKVSRLPKLEPIGDSGHSGKAACDVIITSCRHHTNSFLVPANLTCVHV